MKLDPKTTARITTITTTDRMIRFLFCPDASWPVPFG